MNMCNNQDVLLTCMLMCNKSDYLDCNQPKECLYKIHACIMFSVCKELKSLAGTLNRHLPDCDDVQLLQNYGDSCTLCRVGI